MTQRHRSFDVATPVDDAVTFDINGVDIGKHKWTESFTAVPAIPGAKLLDFISDADSNDGGRASQALVDFLEGVIVPEDRERFQEMIRDETKVIEIETLAAICEWLVEQYAVRPTPPSKSPSPPRGRTGRGSTAIASSRA
jgi:hypothetical protein